MAARPFTHYREKNISSGASDHVTKPVDADDLLRCIHRWLTS
ncbi:MULTISPECIES: hypothetical protein [Micromonospora]|nr:MULTISPECIES: hypothetical protein [unclassified Micromonospora]